MGVSVSSFTHGSNIGPDFAVIHIVTDILLALLPSPLIWSLQLGKRARISLIAILSVGIFAAVAGIIRQASVGPLDEHDTYSIWNFIELHLGIIAASLPALKPLFAQFFDTIRGATNVAKATRHAACDSIAMQPYGNTAAANGRWQRPETSEVSILSPDEKADQGIRVTREVQVY
jgi:hypothetical protein